MLATHFPIEFEIKKKGKYTNNLLCFYLHFWFAIKRMDKMHEG